MVENICSLNDIIKNNSNLVYSICSKYNNYPDKEDLYQVGVIGLINAYKNFDNKRNVKFSTYAFPYIVGEVNKYVRENRNIKVNKDLIKLGKKINEYIQKHKQVRNYEPSIKDISLMLGVKESTVITALESSNAIKSLDDKINNDGREITLLDVMPKEEKISKEELYDLKEAFSYLSIEEQKFIINRYFDDLTQSELAKIMGVNQVYVSRFEKKVLQKLRHKML